MLKKPGYKYESELLGVIHEMMEDLYESGIINEAEMRKFDEDCLVHDDSPGVETYTFSEEDPVLIHA